MHDDRAAHAVLPDGGRIGEGERGVEAAEAGEGGVYVHRYSVYEPYRDVKSHGSGRIHQLDAICGDWIGCVW